MLKENIYNQVLRLIAAGRVDYTSKNGNETYRVYDNTNKVVAVIQTRLIDGLKTIHYGGKRYQVTVGRDFNVAPVRMALDLIRACRRNMNIERFNELKGDQASVISSTLANMR